MIMWTVVSDEILWQQPGSPGRRVEVQMGSRIVVLDVDQQGRATISRLVSSDPRDYMDKRWQPGAPFPLPADG